MTRGTRARRGANLPGGGTRHELLLKIATGATATVYLARTRGKVGRLVAVKRAHPHLVDDRAAREALLVEARIAARLHHVNVAAVHDVEETDEDVLLVMDWIEGASLAELLDAAALAGERIGAKVALRIVLDVCEGLSAVHGLTDDDGRPMQLVHRDVSPQNVLVGVDGVARLSDFGLARLVRRAELSRTTGAVQGKVAYVAPEVVEGAAFQVQSDVFALGVVAWEALAGRRLFRGANEADTLRRVLETRVPPLTEVSDVGPAVAEAIAAALERDPSRRPPSADAFAASLEAAARREGVLGTSRDVSAYVRERFGAAFAERRKVLAAALAVAGGSPAAAGAFAETVSLVGPVPAVDNPVAPSLAADDAPTPIEDRPTLTLVQGGRQPAYARDAGRADDIEDPPTARTTFRARHAAAHDLANRVTPPPRPRSALAHPVAAALAGGVIAITALVMWPRNAPPPETHDVPAAAAVESAPVAAPPSPAPAFPRAPASDDLVVEREDSPPTAASSAAQPRVARPPRSKETSSRDARPSGEASGPSTTAAPAQPAGDATALKPPPNPYLKRR